MQHLESRLSCALRVAILLICLLPTSSQGYGVFQTLRHTETGFDYLDGPSSVAVSPDGRHIYVVGEESILLMERSATSGELIPVQSLKEDALDSIRLSQVVMDPDGLNLYAGSYRDKALMVFSRHPDSGHLTRIQTLYNDFPDLRSLNLLSDLAVTADSRYLYTTAAIGPAIGIFRRNLGDGTLQQVDDVIGETDDLPALQNPQGFALSPDEDRLYVADRDGGLLTFTRDTGDGSLTFQSALGLDVLAPMEPIDVLVDPNGQHLYVSGVEPDPDGYGSIQQLLFMFRREANGDLTRIRTVENVPSSGGLRMDRSGSYLYMTNSHSVTVFERSSEGHLQEIQRLQRSRGASRGGTFDETERYLYVPDSFAERLHLYERNPASGTLELVSTYDDGQGGTVDGLMDIEALYATADGADVYTLTQENKAIAQFRRDASGVLQPGQIISLVDLGLSPIQPLQSWLATPDDRHLIALTSLEKFWIFRRDTDTGHLEFLGQHAVANLYPSDMVFAPDGRTLFVASVSELLVWDFDPATGTFSERATFESPEQAFGSVAIAPDGRYLYAGSDLPGHFGVVRAYLWEQNPDRLTAVDTFRSPMLGDEVSGLQVTPDGNNLLAAGKRDGAGLLVFARDTETGQLTEIQSLVDGQGGLTGFEDPILGSMDPSGVRLVVTSAPFLSPTAESTFLARDPSTGLLEVLEQRSPGDSSRPSGINSYGGLAWSPDGRQFYAFSTILDSLFVLDENQLGDCASSPHVLCLGDGRRFRVEVEWTDFTGQQGSGTKVLESGDSGLFWFFDEANWEMLVKVVDGCGFNGHHWVFAAATTNVAYTLTVTDTLRGVETVYQNPLGVSSAAITDTEALDSCP